MVGKEDDNECSVASNTIGIGDHHDYQTYLKERTEWCKGPKDYVTAWIRTYLYGFNVPQTVFAKRMEVGLPA